MKLDRNTCLGGRLNGKDILGIKYYNYVIYPIEPEVPESPTLYTPYEFRNKTELTEVNTLVTNVHTGLESMFYGCESLTTINGIDTWNTSNVKDMEYMFFSCWDLTELDVSSFNTSKVTNMKHMFEDCSNLITLDLSNFDTSKVDNMTYMFNGCTSLTELNLSDFDINETALTVHMLAGCTSLHTLRLNNCDYTTIHRIIDSGNFPIGDIFDSEGNKIPRKIYVQKANLNGMVAPTGWKFVDIDEQVVYDEPTETLLVPEPMIEATDEQLTINEATYDSDNENLNI